MIFQNEKKFRSLKSTLTGMFLSLGLFVLLLSTALGLYFSLAMQRKIVSGEQAQLAEGAANIVQSFIEEKFNILDQAADVNNLIAAPERQKLVMSKVMGREHSFRRLILLDQNGQEIQSVSDLSSSDEGHVAPFEGELLRSALSGKRYVGPVYIDESTSEPLMVIATPALDVFHEPKGAFVAELNLKFMWDLVGSIHVGEKGSAYVIDKDGTLLAFSDTSRVLRHESTAKLALPSTFIHGTAQPTAQITRGILGTYVVSDLAQLKSPEWAVVVELPVFEAYANVLGILLYSLLILLIGGVISIGVGQYLSLRITKGIVALNNAAGEISRGNLHAKIETFSENAENEIGQLARSFNIMTNTLSDLYATMDDKIKEKTIALSAQVRETEQRGEELKKFKLAVEHTSQHIIITDAEGVILYANDAVTQTTGYAREEIVGQRPSLWGKQMPKEFFEDLWRTIKVEKKSFNGEMQNRRKNGEIYTAAAVISPIVGESGEVKFFVGLETDISKQKALERVLVDEKVRIEGVVADRTRDLQDERARLLASINSLSFGFIIADMNDRVILQNNAMRELFGLSEGDDLTILGVSRLLGEHFDLKVQVERCFNDKEACTIKEIVFGKKFLRGIIAPVLAKDTGEKIGYVFLLEDITEARALERGRDEFFAIASHELRTPLTAIRGNMSMIEDYYREAITNKDVLAMIRDTDIAATRLIAVVNDFLDVSRLEQGQISFQAVDFSANELVRNVVGDLGEVASAKGITLQAEIIDRKLRVRADHDRSKQVLTNLVSNAINYSERGTVTVSVTRSGAFAEFMVHDEGVGISAQNQSLLFRKFQQAGESVLARDATQSTGLGLYISRLVIEPMGGHIWLKKSAVGEGSTFAFTLPLAQEHGDIA